MQYYEPSRVRHDFRILPTPPLVAPETGAPARRGSRHRPPSTTSSAMQHVEDILGRGAHKAGGRRSSSVAARRPGPLNHQPVTAAVPSPQARPTGKRRQELVTNPRVAYKEATKAAQMLDMLAAQGDIPTDREVTHYLHCLRNAVRLVCTTQPPQLESVRDVVAMTDAALQPNGFLASAYSANEGGDGYKASRGFFLSIVGVLHRHGGAMDLALAACEQALAAYTSTAVPVPTDVSSACINLATVRSKMGDYPTAVVYSRDAVAAVQGVDGGESMLAAAYYNVAVNLQHIGDAAAARVACEKAHNVAREYLHPSDATAVAISDLYNNTAYSIPASVVSCRGLVGISDGTTACDEAVHVPEPTMPPAPCADQPDRLGLAFDDDVAVPAGNETGFGGWGTSGAEAQATTPSFLPPLGPPRGAATSRQAQPEAAPVQQRVHNASPASTRSARERKPPAGSAGSRGASKKEKAAMRERAGEAMPPGVFVRKGRRQLTSRGTPQHGHDIDPLPPPSPANDACFARTLPAHSPPDRVDTAGSDRPKTRDTRDMGRAVAEPAGEPQQAWGEDAGLRLPTPPTMPRPRQDECATAGPRTARSSSGRGSRAGSRASSRCGTQDTTCDTAGTLREKSFDKQGRRAGLESLGCRNISMSKTTYHASFKRSQKWLQQLAVGVTAKHDMRQKAAVRIQCAVRCLFARLELYNRRQLLYQLMHEKQSFVANLLLGKMRCRKAKRVMALRMEGLEESIDARVEMERRMDTAAVKIQTLWRRVEERKQSRHHSKQLQATLHRMREKRLNLTANLIQKWWRWVLPRRRYWQQRALEVAEERRIAAENARRAAAAVKLQAWSRGCVERAEVAALKERRRRAHEKWVRDVPVATDIVRYVLRTIAIRKRRAEVAAKTPAQTWYEREQAKIDAAMYRLQRVGRGWFGRGDVDVLVARRLRAAREVEAALVLQRLARRRAAVREVRVRRIRRRCLAMGDLERENVQEDAALAVQRTWRGYRVRLARFRERCAHGRRVIRAVWCLQGFRKIIAAKRMRAALAQRRESVRLERQVADHAAARRIQAEWRRYRGRVAFHEAREEHAELAGLARVEARRELALYDMNKELQRVGRGMRERVRVERQRRTAFAYAARIQRAWRCVQGRRALVTLRKERAEFIAAWQLRVALAEDLFDDQFADLRQVERVERTLIVDAEHAAFDKLARCCTDFDDASSSSSGCYD